MIRTAVRVGSVLNNEADNFHEAAVIKRVAMKA